MHFETKMGKSNFGGQVLICGDLFQWLALRFQWGPPRKDPRKLKPDLQKTKSREAEKSERKWARRPKIPEKCRNPGSPKIEIPARSPQSLRGTPDIARRLRTHQKKVPDERSPENAFPSPVEARRPSKNAFRNSDAGAAPRTPKLKTNSLCDFIAPCNDNTVAQPSATRR